MELGVGEETYRLRGPYPSLALPVFVAVRLLRQTPHVQTHARRAFCLGRHTQVLVAGH